MKRDKPRSGKKWLRAAIPLTVLAGIYLSGVPYTVDERTQAGLYFLGKQPVGMVVGSFVAGKPDSSRLNPVVKWNERMKKIFNKDDEKVVATKTDSSSIDDLTEVAADSLVKTSPFIVDRSPIKPVKIEQGAGLKFKWMSHLVKVKKFSDQIGMYRASRQDILTKDSKYLRVDNIAAIYIENPILFRKRVGSTDIREAVPILDHIVYGTVRNVIGQYNLLEAVRTDNSMLQEKDDLFLSNNQEATKYALASWKQIEFGREFIENKITQISNLALKEWGIKVIRVELETTQLLPDNEQKVYDRIEQERQIVINKYHAQGYKDSLETVSRGKYIAARKVSNAEAYVGRIMGHADQTAADTVASIAMMDPQAYELWNKMRAFKEIIADTSRTGKMQIVLSSDDPIVKYLKGVDPSKYKK